MAKIKNNPLASLSLSGLGSVEEQSVEKGQKLVARAEVAVSTPSLGPLAKLPGTWVGTGFNLIEIPNMNQAKPGPPPADKFKIILNNK
jgi:hypothetical protein